MSLGRREAIAAGRKLLRTFASAPDPRARARAFCADLLGAGEWTSRERQAITAVNSWVMDCPLSAELKPRCEELLAELAKSPR